MTPARFPGDLFQLGYVTNDMEQALRLFHDEYGVRRFLQRPAFDIDIETPEGKRSMKTRLAFAYKGNTMIELIEPAGGEVSVYTKQLPAGRFATVLHHLGFRIEGDLQTWQRFRATIGDAKHPIAIEGGVGTELRFAYVDARQTLGHFVEYLWYSPERLRSLEAIPRN